MGKLNQEMMEDVGNALKVAKGYLAARENFLNESPRTLLGGNDNFIGRIGEFLAMLYLNQYHGLDLKRPRGVENNKSKKAVDLLAKSSDTGADVWWSVKAITSENKKGKTSAYKRFENKFPPLIIVQFNATEKGIQAECLAYPQGLYYDEDGAKGSRREGSLSTVKRFAKAITIPGKVELGVFQSDENSNEQGMWVRLEKNTFQGLKP